MNITSESEASRATRQTNIIETIRDIFASFGYIKLDFSQYEHYDILKEVSLDFSEETTIRYTDRSSGKTLVLRPDFTPQVCRSVAGYMSNYPLPLRIQYSGSIFRTANKNKGERSEKAQIGLELFGNDELFGDTEIILLADKSLKSIGLQGYKIVIGDKELLSYILSFLPNDNTHIKNLIASKSIFELDKELNKIELSKDKKDFIRSIPLLFGQADILEDIKKIAFFDQNIINRINFLQNLSTNLISYGISEETLIFDISESRGLDYYTGVSFDIIHPLIGNVLGGGGRYDTLMAKFGRNIQAAGMAIHIDELMRFDILSDNEDIYDYLVVGNNNFATSISLQNSGKKVIFISDKNYIDQFKSKYIFKDILGSD